MGGRSSKLIGFILTIVFLALAVRNVDLSAVAAELGSADYRFIIPAAVLTFAGYSLRTLRWQTILRPVRRLSWPTLFGVLMVGFAANNVLPARIGELVRAYILARRAAIPGGLTLATIVVERVFDGLTLLFLMALALQVAPVPLDNDRLRLVEIASVAIFASAVVVLILLLTLQERALALMRWLLRPLPERIGQRITGIAQAFIEGLRCLRHPVLLVEAAVISLLVWIAEASSYALVARAFSLSLEPRQYISAVIFLVVFVNLGIMIPSAPGYIGTFQFFARLALAAFAVAPERAVGLALVSHAMQYILVTGIGLAMLWRQQLSLNVLARAPVALDSTGD